MNASDARRTRARRLQRRMRATRNMKSFLLRVLFRGAAFLTTIPSRLMEILAALCVCTLLFVPVCLCLLIRKFFRGTPVFRTWRIVGEQGLPLTLHTFNTISKSLEKIPLFALLFSGRITLVGTAMTPWEDHVPAPKNRYIRIVKPGIFSLWHIRKASRIAHEGKDTIQWEYIFKKKPLYDFLLLLRMIPAFFYGDGPGISNPVLRLFNLDIENRTMEDAVAQIASDLDGTEAKTFFFVNPDCLNKIFNDPEYFKILQTSDHLFPDGIGLTIAGKILQSPLLENINGTDMLPFICTMAAARNHSIFLLGSRPGTAQKMGERIHEAYGVRIAGHAHGYFDHAKESEERVRTINASGADILLVAFGAPLQEKWIAAHKDHLRPRVLMGVGGLFDFFSGTTRRAPSWVREIGMEWVYRILQEPGRMWRRYVIGNPAFLFRVTRWKLFSHLTTFGTR